MQFLWRVSPRAVRYGFAAQLTQHQKLAAGGDVNTTEFFGRVSIGQVSTAQGGQTTDGALTVVSGAAPITTGQGGQTSDVVGFVRTDGAAVTAQGGQSTTGAAYHDEIGHVVTAQGGQSTSVSGFTSTFQSVRPHGWLDASIPVPFPHLSFWRVVPAARSINQALFRRGVLDAEPDVAADAFFPVRTRYEYADGIGAHVVSYPLGTRQVFPDDFDASSFGTAAFTGRKKIYPLGFDSRVFGTALFTHWQQFIRPGGFNAFGPGTPHVTLFARLVPMQGFDVSVFGLPALLNLNRYMRPYGIFDFEAGLPDVSHKNRLLWAWGRNQQEFGTPHVYNLQQTIQPKGFTLEWLGEPTVVAPWQFIECVVPVDSMDFTPAEDEEDRMTVVSSIGVTQRIYPEEFALEDEDDLEIGVGFPILTYWLQRIVFTQTVEMTQWGLPRVSDSPRYIQVPWSTFTQWGLPIFGWTAVIKPYGIPPGDFGLPHVELGSLRQMQGWDSSRLGLPEAKSMRRIVKVGNWQGKDVFGNHLVFLKTQYIQVENHQFFDPYPIVSLYHDVRLRDFYSTPAGFDSLRIPNTHRARLTGQQTLPTAGDQTQWGEGTFIAYRIRRVYPSWRFAGFVDPYHFVHNYATRIYPLGFDSMSFAPYPYHRVWFNLQTIKPRFIKDDGYGKPFIAYRYRGLQPFNTYFGEKFGTPWISLRTRTLIELPYTPEYAFGTPVVRSHRNIIKTQSIAFNDYGLYAQVRNVTPQLFPSMATQTTYGTPWVSRAPRFITPGVVLTTTVGVPEVLFRDRYVFVFAIMETAIGSPTVRQEIEETRSNQLVFPFGIGAPAISNRHEVNGQPFPEGWDSLIFGANTSIRMQGCSPRWDVADSVFGFPIIIFTQVITQTNADDEMGAQTRFDPQRIDPHTIWARIDTPAQAIRNHPEGDKFYPVDLFSNSISVPTLPPWFGLARVHSGIPGGLQHYHGIGPDKLPDQTVGEVFGGHTIANSKHYIEPVGFNSARYGFPTLPHPVKIWGEAFLSPEFADTFHIVSRPPFSTQWLKPSTIGLTERFGVTEVQNKNRELRVFGFSATLFGNNFPMVYHYPRGPTQVGGDDHAQISNEHWVSHYIRYFQMEGWDSFTEGYTIEQFEDRMRVTREADPLQFSAGNQLQMGVPKVTEARAPRRIGPYMIPPPELCHPHHVELEEA